MENTVVERALPWDAAPEDQELSFPDVETFVQECVSTSTDASGVHQKLMGAITQATEEISRLGNGQAYEYVKCLSRIAKGLRKNTEDNHAFRFFYFGQFQTRLDMLEQELESNHSETQILAVASRKHFAPIMQMLYAEEVCQQQELSNRLGIDRSNLSREMQGLLDSGLVDSKRVGRFRYYLLTPQGHRYYNTYLVMKTQLEEKVYSPPENKNSAVKEASPRYFLSQVPEIQISFSSNGWKGEFIFDDEYAKPRVVINDLRRDNQWQQAVKR